MDEEELIGLMTSARGAPLPIGALGPGDDAAVLPWAGDEDVIVTTDLVAEGVHFPPAAEPRDVGRFLAAVNLSDLAAMGAAPRGFVVAYGVPADTRPAWLEAVARGLAHALARHDCPLLGGDTKEAGARVLTGTALGALPRGKGLLRRGARPGDAIVATGPFGGPGAVLHAWGRGAMDEKEAARGLLAVEPRVAAGILFREAGAHALIDTSDGLARSAVLLARASKTRIEIDAAAVPVDGRVAALVGSTLAPELWRSVVLGTGGEYELLAAVPPEMVPPLTTRLAALRLSAAVVGRCVAGTGAFLRDGAGAQDLGTLGWRHFRGRKA